MGKKGGIILYHIGYGGYGKTLGCFAINGVIGYCQPRCWLTSVGWVAKLSYDWICGTGKPTFVTNVLVMASVREVLNSSLINCFNLSSTKGQFLNSCPTY